MILKKGEKMKYNKEDRRIVNEALTDLADSYDENDGWLKEDRDEKAGVYILKAYTGYSHKNKRSIEEFNQTKLHDGKTIKWHFLKAWAPGEDMEIEVRSNIDSSSEYSTLGGEYFTWEIPLSLLKDF